MKCFQCGAEIPDISRFCPICGRQVTPAAEIGKTEIVPPAQSTPVRAQPNPGFAPPTAQDFGFSQPAALDLGAAPRNTTAAQPAPGYTQPAPAYAQPAPSYTQSAPAYTQPAPSYAQPNPGYFPQRDDREQPDAQPTPKKKSKKGLIIGLCSGGLLLIAAAVLAYFLFFAGSPLTRALQKTAESLDEMLDAGNLGLVKEHLETLGKDGRETIGVDVTVNNIHVTGQIHADGEASLYSGRAEVTIESNPAFPVDFSTDLKNMVFGTDGVSGYYGINLTEYIRKNGGDPSLLEKMSTKQEPVTLDSLKNGPLKPVFDSMKSEEVGQTAIRTDAGTEKICAHYVLRWDAAAVKQVKSTMRNETYDGGTEVLGPGELPPTGGYGQTVLYAGIPGMLVELMDMVSPTMDVYVCDGRILGADFHAKNSNASYYLRLLGANNPFEHVRFTGTSINNTVDLYWEKGGNIRLCSLQEGRELEILRYTDWDGSIVVNSEAAFIGIAPQINLTPTEKGACLRVAVSPQGQQIAVSLDLEPQAVQPAMLSDSYIDVLNMDGAQQNKLMQEVSAIPGVNALLRGSEIAGYYVCTKLEQDGEVYDPSTLGLSYYLMVNADGTGTFYYGKGGYSYTTELTWGFAQGDWLWVTIDGETYYGTYQNGCIVGTGYNDVKMTLEKQS